MKLSANTSLYRERPDGERWSIEQAVRAVAKAGFEAVELNFAEAIRPGSFFAEKNWETEIERIGLAAEECGLMLIHSHLPFYNFATPGHENLEYKAKMFSRVIRASGMLGIRWGVFHAGNAPDAVMGRMESKRRTLEYLTPFMEDAAKAGVGFAIENLFIPEYLNSTRRYCAHVEEVIDLADSLGENACICWDFGHANLIRDDQAECLRAVGKRLKMIHVHDNNGVKDQHAAPYTAGCTIDWAAILPVLGEIGYEGTFNFEVAAGRVPSVLRDGFNRYLVETGKQMAELVKRGRPEKK